MAHELDLDACRFRFAVDESQRCAGEIVAIWGCNILERARQQCDPELPSRSQ
jgi:hypothetical protein